jgi:hypothetical protein
MMECDWDSMWKEGNGVSLRSRGGEQPENHRHLYGTVPHGRASHPAGQATHQNNTSTSMRYNLIKIRKRKRSETPPEAIGSSDEARYAEQEKRASKRADYDMDYKEYSSIKSFSD